jgi:hypothetical protein
MDETDGMVRAVATTRVFATVALAIAASIVWTR